MTDAAPPPKKWFQTWWGILLLAVGGSVLPQLCALIPNAVGSRICAIVVNSAVVTFSPAPTTSTQPPPPAVVLEECAPERRLSTGKCLPP